jgi:hypothetical protein
MRVFELEDVIDLLRAEVVRAGGQVAWSKKTGINRTIPRSRHNPKILWIDDAEIVGDRIT